MAAKNGALTMPSQNVQFDTESCSSRMNSTKGMPSATQDISAPPSSAMKLA